MNLSSLVGNTAAYIQKNSPAILTALGVVGIISTAVLSHRAGAQSVAKLNHVEEAGEFKETNTRLEYAREVIRHTWPYYVAPVITIGVTVACVITANTISTRRQAAVISAFTLTEKAFSEYRDKNVEMNGRKHDQKVVDAVAQDNAQKRSESVIVVGPGRVPCFDAYSGRQFECTAELIRKAENEINRKCINENGATLNDYYRLVGLPSIPVGDEVGWNTDKPLEIMFSSYLIDDIPVLEAGFRKHPFPEHNSPW